MSQDNLYFVSKKFVVYMTDDDLNENRQPIKTLKKFTEFDSHEQAEEWVKNYLTNQRYARTFVISKMYSNNNDKIQ
jgi:hypothetical protein